MAEVRPVLVRVPSDLADRLTVEAADKGCSRHSLMVDKLAHECQERTDEPPPAP